MPYIGNPIYQSAFVVDQFNGNGSTTAFTMSVAPAGVTNVLVAVSGVLQDPSTYGVVGNTITFTAAPPSGTGNISCRYLGVPASGVTTTAYRTVTEFTATASQTTFTPPSYTVGFINVYLNGVLLGSADYTATNGTTVVLTTGALAGNLVTVESFLVSSVLNAIANTNNSVTALNLALGASAYNLASVSGTTYNLEYLIVAGGGGGGGRVGGGGGGGGVLNGFVTVTSGTGYSLVIGAGGTGGASGVNGTVGSNSTGFSLTAIGGGNGMGLGGAALTTGGSGGGSSFTNNAFGAGTAGQGFNGASSFTAAASYGGGGGGGAGSPGTNGTNGSGGNGGNGLLSRISGSYAFYAGGGGGGVTSVSGGNGGAGGGALGGNNTVGSNASANTGGGGGGGGDGLAGGNGGSGIVIVSYPGATRGTGGTITSVNGYTIHTFTSNGTFTA